MSTSIELKCQKVHIIFEKNKVTLSPQRTGAQAFSVIPIPGDDELSEMVATDYYHTSELLTVIPEIKAIAIESQLIQAKTIIPPTIIDAAGNPAVIDAVPEVIDAVYAQTLTLPNIIDKNKMTQLLQLFVDNKLIFPYEKEALLAMYEKEHPSPKVEQLSPEDLFRQSLVKIKAAQKDMLNAAGDKVAAGVAGDLYWELTQAFETFQKARLEMPYIASKEKSEQPYLAFKERCDIATAKAKETLGNYWDWNSIFLNLKTAVATLGVGGVAVELYNNYKQGNPLLIFKSPYADGTLEKQLEIDDVKTNSQKIMP